MSILTKLFSDMFACDLFWECLYVEYNAYFREVPETANYWRICKNLDIASVLCFGVSYSPSSL